VVVSEKIFPRTYVCDRFSWELLGIRSVSPLVTRAIVSPSLKFDKQ